MLPGRPDVSERPSDVSTAPVGCGVCAGCRALCCTSQSQAIMCVSWTTICKPTPHTKRHTWEQMYVQLLKQESLQISFGYTPMLYILQLKCLYTQTPKERTTELKESLLMWQNHFCNTQLMMLHPITLSQCYWIVKDCFCSLPLWFQTCFVQYTLSLLMTLGLCNSALQALWGNHRH